jgi:hypothetical protein
VPVATATMEHVPVVGAQVFFVQVVSLFSGQLTTVAGLTLQVWPDGSQ